MFQIKVVEKIKTHISCSIAFLRKSFRLWDYSKNVVEAERPRMTIWRRVSCWVTKATRAKTCARVRAPTPTHALRTRMQSRALLTHTKKYVILIAFPRQQWFRERALILRYTYSACLVSSVLITLLVLAAGLQLCDSTTLRCFEQIRRCDSRI